MQHFSLLDLAPVPEGHTAAEALRTTSELARMADLSAYHRYWLAEHHNMPGIASAATSVLIGHVAALTRRIRVGAGGIMLPNHSPLVVAEQFGTLATLHPDRIDLGLGRAPGTDVLTARALRRHLAGGDSFPQDVVELLGYFADAGPETRVQAIPGTGTHVPVWILGSSLYGAQLAAYLGLPYAFASHFAPAMLGEALATYRETFRPSEYLQEPRFMMAVGVCAAETDEEAHYLHSSQVLAFARLRSGMPGKLPRPTRDLSEVSTAMRAQVDQALACTAVGSRETVRETLTGFVESYRPDEMIVGCMIHDPAAHIRSYEIAAEVLSSVLSRQNTR
ncbi:LLM class flavin-dependent oxidoreductase [Tropicimonas sp.]|uniref:LLM class flavin-dependent oxidoreductase n=1 Tax=Tropicimonas sp. TaxID=2067044 RepID=UPI003A8BBF7D